MAIGGKNSNGGRLSAEVAAEAVLAELDHFRCGAVGVEGEGCGVIRANTFSVWCD